MTRINIIPVEELMDQHLIAEDELKNPKPFACLVKYVGDYDM